jgi:hypothetical protein
MTIKRMALLACLLSGVCLLLTACYVLATEIYFVHKAKAFDTSIVEVRKELVHKGKGSTMAYVPVVEIASGTDRNFRMTVDTFSEELVYRVGDKMDVLCDLSHSPRCIKNTFASKWGDSVLDFVFALVFLTIPWLYYWRSSQSKTTPVQRPIRKSLNTN